jgi:hypothetical protein
MEFDALAVLPVLEMEDLEDAAEMLLSGFVTAHPESGPVASVDLRRRTFDVAFTVQAPDAYEAIEIAKRVFSDAAENTELAPRPLDGFHVDVAAPDLEPVSA